LGRWVIGYPSWVEQRLTADWCQTKYPASRLRSLFGVEHTAGVRWRTDPQKEQQHIRLVYKKETLMLRNTKDLENFAIRATDGEIGKIKDMYFDDDAWVLRYFIVETGSWLSSRKVLISPVSVREPDWSGKTLPAAISKSQVSKSPDIDTDKPVSRQNEEQYFGYYGYPYYWAGMGIWGDGLYPYGVPPYISNGPGWAERQREDETALAAERSRHRNDDPHLRSCEAVSGYHVHATDGEIGHVSGFLVDEATWAIRYLIVDTSNWWMGHEVLIAPPWISGVRWSDKTVSVDLDRASVKASPPYDPNALPGRDWERNLHNHFGRTGYWSSAEALEAHR
jgi:hypothetical protein